jgi:uncharacterized membrane protein required for colicin V production
MLGFVAAFVAVVKLGPSIGAWLPLGGPGESLREDMGALIALIVTLFLGHQAVVLHRKLFTRSGPQPAHRTLGGIFGMVSGVFVLLLVSAMIDLTAWRESNWWKGTTEESVTRFLLEHMKSSVKPSETSPPT